MKKNDIEGIDACVCMHTALRKCCDSKITSAAYNLIHIIDIRPEKFDAWRILGNLVAEGMNRSDVNWSGSVALASAVEKLLDEFHGVHVAARNKGEELPENARATMHALHCVLQCFDDADLQGMAAYLDE